MKTQEDKIQKTIPKADYHALVGLLYMAKLYGGKMTDIIEAIRVITGDEEEFGHSADAVYGAESPGWLMERLGIAVEKEKNDYV